MEFKQFRRVIPIVKEIAQNLQQFTEKVITNINKVLENGVFSDSAKEAFTDIKAEAANQKENFAKAASQEAEAVKEEETTQQETTQEETTQEETTTDTTKESKMENPTEGINEESKKASSVIVNIAEFINSVLVKTVKVASSIEAVLIALSNLANTLGASSMTAAL